MGEVNSFESVIDAAIRLSPAMQTAKVRHDAVFSKLEKEASDVTLPSEKRAEAANRIEIIRTAIGIFSVSSSAYMALNDNEEEENRRLIEAGTWFEQVRPRLEYFKKLTSTDDKTVDEKLQTISEWLEKKGYSITLPVYVSAKDGRITHVTAAGMIADMNNCISMCATIRRAANRPENRVKKSSEDNGNFAPSPTHFERRQQK